MKSLDENENEIQVNQNFLELIPQLLVERTPKTSLCRHNGILNIPLIKLITM
jgi:hypothetical protein